ncbi:MAG: hypothetical protein KAS39_02990 [Actinomycetia bacterium]|nr:hypothetical protein [Actinomycetes bacterium]
MGIKLGTPSWLVFEDPDTGKLEAEKEFDDSALSRDDLEFIGAKLLGNPTFDRKQEAISWVIAHWEK